MNGTEAAFSYTLKTPADNLLTVRGDDYDEFFNNLVAIGNDDELVTVLAKLQAGVGKRTEAVSVDHGSPRRGSAQPRSEPAQSRRDPFDDGPEDADGHYCKHGEMQFKSGTSKANKSYSGYFCPANDKMCKPVWGN